MQIKPDEITSILKSRIEGLDTTSADLAEVGTVLSVADGIARVHGLENCMSFEMLELPHGVTGLALNLESDNVGAVLFGDWEKIVEGDTVRRTSRLLEIPVGDALLGRIVDPLGNPLDGKGPISTSETRPIEHKAPGVVQRQPVKEPLQTGIKAIDSMIPDRPWPARADHRRPPGPARRRSRFDTIINNKDTGVVSIYVAIGQRKATVVALAKAALEDAGAFLQNTIIVMAAADESAPITLPGAVRRLRDEECFLYKGVATALTIYDDLTWGTPTRTARCRCSPALSRRAARHTPATSSTLHSRAARARRQAQRRPRRAASLRHRCRSSRRRPATCRAYIPTNVISITDGQVFLEPKLFNSGVRPARSTSPASASRAWAAAPRYRPMRRRSPGD